MSPLDEVTLELNFYQDYLNGTINSQLGNRLATLGSTKSHKTRVNTEQIKKNKNIIDISYVFKLFIYFNFIYLGK